MITRRHNFGNSFGMMNTIMNHDILSSLASDG